VALTTRSLFGRPSGFLPLCMSAAALAVVALALAIGVTEQADEGVFARTWQILMAGQVPVIGWFAVRWLPLAPRAGAQVLALQLAAALVALLPVYLLRL
jgi:hypothetical protein